MTKAANVSLNVHSNVSLLSYQKLEPAPRTKSFKKAPGRYLVRNGNTLLFQIRIPKSLTRSCGSIVRLSLGAISLREARETADELASFVRKISRVWGRVMSEQEKGDKNKQAETDEDRDALLEINAHALNFMLKSAQYDMRKENRAPTDEETKGHELVKNLLAINNQLEAKERGETHNSLISDNADLMADAFGEKWRSGLIASTLNADESLVAPQPEDDISSHRTIAQQEHNSSSYGIEDAHLPAFQRDRRVAPRPKSRKPAFSEIAAEYFALRESASSAANKDIKIARFRTDLFIELIGNHPIDTYTGTDLQAFIELLKFWPAEEKDRQPDKTALEIIDNNRDMHLRPLARKTLSEGYMAIVKTVINSGQTRHDYSTPIAHTKLVYPDTARPSVAAEPLSAQKIELLFRTGVETGHLDNTMLPLLGFLTGRRLGLLVHLKGSDIREKFEGVWVAQTDGIIQLNGKWQRNPIKTGASTSFFVLHNFLKEIGFVDWAIKQGNEFLFSELIRLAEPSKSASSYMARLLDRKSVV